MALNLTAMAKDSTPNIGDSRESENDGFVKISAIRGRKQGVSSFFLSADEQDA